jgi:hypothetical protein
MSETISAKYWKYYKENRCLGMNKELAMLKAHEQIEEGW